MLNNRKIKLKIKEKEVIQKHITTDFIRLDAFLSFVMRFNPEAMQKSLFRTVKLRLTEKLVSREEKSLG